MEALTAGVAPLWLCDSRTRRISRKEGVEAASVAARKGFRKLLFSVGSLVQITAHEEGNEHSQVAMSLQHFL